MTIFAKLLELLVLAVDTQSWDIVNEVIQLLYEYDEYGDEYRDD